MIFKITNAIKFNVIQLVLTIAYIVINYFLYTYIICVLICLIPYNYALKWLMLLSLCLHVIKPNVTNVN